MKREYALYDQLAQKFVSAKAISVFEMYGEIFFTSRDIYHLTGKRKGRPRFVCSHYPSGGSIITGTRKTAKEAEAEAKSGLKARTENEVKKAVKNAMGISRRANPCSND